MQNEEMGCKAERLRIGEKAIRTASITKLARTISTIDMHFNAGYLIKEYFYLFDVVVFARWASGRWCSGRVLSQEERRPTSRTFWSSFRPEMPWGTMQVKNDRTWCFGGDTVRPSIMLIFTAICDAVFSEDMSVMNKGRVLDAVHSLWHKESIASGQSLRPRRRVRKSNSVHNALIS